MDAETIKREVAWVNRFRPWMNDARISVVTRAVLGVIAIVGPDGGRFWAANRVMWEVPKRTVDFVAGVLEMLEAGQVEEAERAMSNANLTQSRS